ncbi:MAG: hypothetical protein AB7I12_13455 [Steroidobacteraceae bacterium]
MNWLLDHVVDPFRGRLISLGQHVVTMAPTLIRFAMSMHACVGNERWMDAMHEVESDEVAVHE